MADLGKLLLVVGLGLVVVGGAAWLLGRPGFRGLPGDIRCEGERVRVYFPIVTCLALSILLTLLASLWSMLTRK